MTKKKRTLEAVPAELDHLDFSILSYLRKDSKTPLKKMAKELGIHPNTLIQRIRKMESGGVIKKYAACVDYSKTGYDLHIIVMIKVKRGRVALEQLKDLTKVKELEAVYAATGVWDAIALCRVKNRQHLLEVIEKIGDQPIVLKTSSAIILHTYKNHDDYNPFM
jgi:DNA-binding Lrp family transcriptional regulator